MGIGKKAKTNPKIQHNTGFIPLLTRILLKKPVNIISIRILSENIVSV